MGQGDKGLEVSQTEKVGSRIIWKADSQKLLGMADLNNIITLMKGEERYWVQNLHIK